MKKIISLLLVMVLTMPGLAGCGILEKLCSHTFDELETLSSKPATCSESGFTEGKKCALCGKIIIEQEELSPLGHIYEYTSEFDEEGNRVNVAICERENCTERKIVTDKERLIGEWRNAAGVYEGEIIADYYIARYSDSGRAALEIMMSSENIYFGDELYEVEYVSNPGFAFNSKNYYPNASKFIDQDMVAETIEKIKQSDSCYVLTTEAKKLKILIYKIEECYYFVNLQINYYGDEYVDIIHFTKFNQET